SGSVCCCSVSGIIWPVCTPSSGAPVIGEIASGLPIGFIGSAADAGLAPISSAAAAHHSAARAREGDERTIMLEARTWRLRRVAQERTERAVDVVQIAGAARIQLIVADVGRRVADAAAGARRAEERHHV